MGDLDAVGGRFGVRLRDAAPQPLTRGVGGLLAGQRRHLGSLDHGPRSRLMHRGLDQGGLTSRGYLERSGAGEVLAARTLRAQIHIFARHRVRA
jgi:hypothetical protein